MLKRYMLCIVALVAFCTRAATEKVDGIIWIYTVLDGEASLSHYSPYGNTEWCSGAITIPSTLGGCPVTSIGFKEFILCPLTSVIIPDSVVGIGGSAFQGCSTLIDVVIRNGKTCIESGGFSMCSSLKNFDAPNGVASIGSAAFKVCKNLKNIKFSDHARFIGEHAFSGCESIEWITIPNSVTNIGEHAFSACVSLKGVTISDNIASIEDSTFFACHSLESVIIPSRVRSIEHYAFKDCKSLRNVSIPNCVTNFDVSAFDGCHSSLYDTSSIPGVRMVDRWVIKRESGLPANLQLEGIQGIAGGVFSGCTSLTKVTIQPGATCIGGSAFSNCSSLKSITIPDSITYIGKSAFFNCSSLTGVKIPSAITRIEDNAFYYCSSLTSVTIPDSVTSIGREAFWGCRSLESVTIPDSVKSIGRNAFHGVRYARVPLSLKSQVEENSVFTDYVYRDVDGKYTEIQVIVDYYDESSVFPEISKDSEIKAAFEGAADTNLTANITNVAEYAAYREWALGLKDTTEAEVKQSPYSWVSYALDTDKLISSPPKDGDFKIDDFKLKHNVTEDGSIEFELCASVDEIKIGDGATKDNLNKIFKIWGAETLEGLRNKETRQEVEASTAEPSDGGVKFKFIRTLKDALTPQEYHFVQVVLGFMG